MNFTLTRYQRALLFFLSAAGYSAWFSGVGERLEAQDMGPGVHPQVTLVSRPLSPSIPSLVTRDPFAGSALAPSAPARANAMPQAAGARVVPDIEPDSPDAVPTVTNLVVRATIAGSNPVAYVASGTMMNIVRVGDSLGERRITDIDLRGLSFSDGSRLDLPDTYLATPAPRRAGNDTINVRLQDLRKLLAPEQSRATPAAGIAPASLATNPAGQQASPTPAPLATVDRNGHPAGTIFTPDPNAPTAFPYPYPYAPAAR